MNLINFIKSKIKRKDVPYKNRVELLIKYFIQCIENDKHNTMILNHINNIFAYQKNLEKFFDVGRIREYGAYDFKNGNIENDNRFTIRVLSIAMELLSSENIYKEYYIKEQQGLENLKEIFRRMYILKKGKRDSLNSFENIEKDIEQELNQFIDDIFDVSKYNKNHSIKDFLKEYYDLLEQNVTDEEYDSSLIKKNYESDIEHELEYPFGLPLTERSIFNLEFEDDLGKKSMNYEEMYNEEKFEFIMNYILALYQVELDPNYFGVQPSEPFTVAKYAVFRTFGHQCNKKKKVIVGKIDDISVYEENYKENNYPFSGSGAEPHAVYSLCAISEGKEYELFYFGCDPEIDDKYSWSGERIGGIAGSSGVTAYGLNITKEQIIRIFEIIKNFIIDKDGCLNLANEYDMNTFCCCITMMELYNDAYKDSRHHNFISEKIKELQYLIEFSNINYLQKLESPEKIEFESKEQQAFYNIINNHMNYNYVRAYIPLTYPYYIYDCGQRRFVAEESNKIKKNLKEKYKAFLQTQRLSAEVYKKIIKNIDKFSNLNGEDIEKYLNLLYELGSPYEEEDEPKQY